VKKKFPLIHQIEDCLNQTFGNNLKNITFDLALSGGKDSMTLLHLLNDLSITLGFKLRAIHIHHGLSNSADHWLNLCKETCVKKGIEFISSKVQVEEKHELGIEGRARELRYQELNRLKKGILVTAHHQQDQVETFMLQLLRGSGLKGLSSMQVMDDQRSLLRPMLNINPELIDEYVRANNIEHVNDESNAYDRFDRNYLRNNVLPNLIKRSPSTLANIARSISLIAEGYQLNESIAISDFKKFIDQSDLSRIRLDAFNQLPKDRFINLVRFWLSMNDLLMPSMRVMQELFDQMSLKNHLGLNAVDVSKATKIIAYQDFLWIVNTTKATDYEIDWHGEREINLPSNGRLNFIKKKGQGLDLKKLDNLKIRNRRGGEKIKLAINEHTRTLKNLLNNHQIPPWYRDQFPVLVSDKDVVAVPIFGVNYEYQVKGPCYGYILDWQPSK